MRFCLVAVIVAFAVLVLLTDCRGVPAAPAQGFVLASAETTATPASPAVVKRALAVERSARDAQREWRRAKRCLVERARLRLAGRPTRSAPAAVWLDAAEKWREQRRDFRLKTAKCVAKMRHPGGHPSGERWLPLARWVGWPEAQLGTLIWIMAKRGPSGVGESGGCPGAYNPVIGCTGLMQVWPQHVVDWLHLSWSAAVRWLKDAENNLRAALRLWRAEGWTPWAL